MLSYMVAFGFVSSLAQTASTLPLHHRCPSLFTLWVVPLLCSARALHSSQAGLAPLARGSLTSEISTLFWLPRRVGVPAGFRGSWSLKLDPELVEVRGSGSCLAGVGTLL